MLLFLLFLRYFSVTKNGSILSAQRGVFRINCIDCLDRTNVVQGLLAKRMLHIQLIVNKKKHKEYFFFQILILTINFLIQEIKYIGRK